MFNHGDGGLSHATRHLPCRVWHEGRLRQNGGVNDEDWLRFWEEAQGEDPLVQVLKSTLERYRSLPVDQIGAGLSELVQDRRLDILAIQKLKICRNVDEAITLAAAILAKLDAIADRRRQTSADGD